MAEATVAMVLMRLAPMIDQRVRDEVWLLLNSTDEVKKLIPKLKKIQEVLERAEVVGVTDDQVKSWLKKLEELSYEMDDALDDWEYVNVVDEQLDRPESGEVHAVKSSKLWDKVRFFVLSIALCCEQVVKRRDIALQIKDLNQRLGSVAKDVEDENCFVPNVGGYHRPLRFEPIHDTYFVDVSKVRGRKTEKDRLVGMLLSDGEESGFRTISIVGGGGIGKTTLAELAFNDPRLKTAGFDLKSWVDVSSPFDQIKIAKAILQDLGQDAQDLSGFRKVLGILKLSISSKKFLLVLDNVWTDDYGKWEALNGILGWGAPGSRVLVTTRNERVANMMGSQGNRIVHLESLSKPDCWALFKEIAFFGKIDVDIERLEKNGMEIVDKCNGLPLAVKTMASLLRFRKTTEEWENVLKSGIWQLDEVKIKLYPHLYLSYNDLTPVMRHCFSYCAMFPKDARISVTKLIKMWMAQGYLSASKITNRMELQGREYFDNIAMRSLFEDFVKDAHFGERIVSCKLHNIVHDFARFLRQTECYVIDRVNGRVEMGTGASYPSARHLAMLEPELAKTALEFIPIEKLRSFLCEKKLPLDLFIRLKSVRVLSASQCNLKELPTGIGKLIHLRYLDLSGNPLEQLPESLCDLYNLQTLDLDECEDLRELPQGFGRLRRLRHLLIHDTPNLDKFPQGFQKLTDLQTLNKFKEKKGSNNLGFLKDLNQIRGSIYVAVEDLNEAADVVEAQNAQLKDKRYIQNLELDFQGNVSFDVFEALQPPSGLQRLGISSFQGIMFPHWITKSLDFLRVLEFEQCHGCSSLPPLGKLQSLEKLFIKNMKGIERLGHDFLGLSTTGTTYKDSDEFHLASPASPRRTSLQTSPPKTVVVFPKLKELHFVHLPKWEKWDDLTEDQELKHGVLKAFPCLQSLRVERCPELRSLPGRLLREVKYLNIQDSTNLIARYQEKVERDLITAMKTIDGQGQKSSKQLRKRSLLHSFGQTIFGSGGVPKSILHSAARNLSFFNDLPRGASDELSVESNLLPGYLEVEHSKNKNPKITDLTSKMGSVPHLQSSGNLVLCEIGREEKGSRMVTLYSLLGQL